MSTPDPMGDRLDRVLADLEQLEHQLNRILDNDFFDHVQNENLGVAYTYHLASLIAKIVRQQHEIIVLLEHESGRRE